MKQTASDTVKVESPIFRVLTIIARPLNQSALPEIGDAWSLADRLARARLPAMLAFTRPPTVEALRCRSAENWDVIHFDGHGMWAWFCPSCGQLIPKEELQSDLVTCPQCAKPLTEPATGYLAFEREDGLMDLLSATDMAALICPPGIPPRAHLVILTACQSAMGSPSLADVLLAAGVPAVLAMQETVTVKTVIECLLPFYANLAAGHSPRQSLETALSALRRLGTSPISGTPWEEIPVLLGPEADAPLCEPGCRAEMQVERQLLIGVPAPSFSGAFHGDFEEATPPEGRKGYLVRLAQAFLRGEKLIVLAGVGGIGKSALAAALVRRMAWRYPGGILWVDGRDYLETGMRLVDLLSTFSCVCNEGFGQLPIARQRELAMAYLRRIEAPTLLVIDNADVANEEVWRFLQDVPQPSAVLVTTRAAPEYGACVLNIVAMTPREGLTFLMAEIGRRRNAPYWARVMDEPSKCKLLEIARLLDGHALALLQAGAMAGDVGLDHALKQVQANPFQGETECRFDFSYSPLPESPKDLLHRLSAFAADFSLQAVEALCTNPLGQQEDFELLTTWATDLPELVRASFVERYPLRPGHDRFRLHPVMREYLRHRAGPEVLAVHTRRFAHLCLDLARWGCGQLGNPETALQAVTMATVERANLLAAQEIYSTQDLWNEAVNLAYNLNKLFARSGHWSDQRRVLEMGIEAAQRVDSKVHQAILTHNLAVAFERIGEYRRAEGLLSESLALKREVGNEDLGEPNNSDAATLHELGNIASLHGDYDKARCFYQEAVGIFKRLGAQCEQAAILNQLGSLAQAQGDYSEASQLHQEALSVFEACGDHEGVAIVHGNLGNLAYRQDNYKEAKDRWEASLIIFRELGDLARIAGTLQSLGTLAWAQRDCTKAQSLYQEAYGIFEQLGDHVGAAGVLNNLGRLAEEIGDLETAERLFSVSLAALEACSSSDAAIARRSLERVRELLKEQN